MVLLRSCKRGAAFLLPLGEAFVGAGSSLPELLFELVESGDMFDDRGDAGFPGFECFYEFATHVGKVRSLTGHVWLEWFVASPRRFSKSRRQPRSLGGRCFSCLPYESQSEIFK